MKIDQLRHHNKSIIVDHVFKAYGNHGFSTHDRDRWIEYLVYGGDFRGMLEALKCNQTLPQTNMHTALTHAQTVQGELGSIMPSETDLVFQAGEAQSVSIRVENTSSITWQTSKETPIRHCYHWYFANGNVCIYNGQPSSLSEPIVPGEIRNFSVSVLPPEAAGSYLLELTMVMDGQFWFEERGLRTQRIPVRVELPELSAHARHIYTKLLTAIAQETMEKM